MMHRCHVCRKTLGEPPFACPWCGDIFCFDHLLPENHRCPRPRQYDRRPQLKEKVTVCRNCGRELKGVPVPCHWCGKVLCDYCRSRENHICRNKIG